MTTATKTTSTKATKSTKAAPKTAPVLVKSGVIKTDGKAPKATKTPKAKKPVVMIKSGDSVVINEAVGVHFSADPKTAPKMGQEITLKLNGEEIPLMVKFTKAKVNGSVLVMSFVIKGTGAYAMLEENKGKTATIHWN